MTPDSKLSLSQRAAEQVRRVFKDEGRPPESFLRLTVRVGATPSGFTWGMEADTQFDPERDHRFPSQQMDIVVDGETLRYVQASVLCYEVDYVDGPSGSGFTLNTRVPEGLFAARDPDAEESPARPAERRPGNGWQFWKRRG